MSPRDLESDLGSGEGDDGARLDAAVPAATTGPSTWSGDDPSTAGTNPSTAMATVVVDELVRGGVQHVVLAPGSRSTALAVAVAARSDLTLHVRHDERSAAFVALGLGRASGRPAAVVTTSGTAVANLGPAVAEAHTAGVPLVVLTADRPAERQHVGANQTFAQAGLFTTLVRWHVVLAAADTPDEPRTWRAEVARAVAAARGIGGALPPDAGGPAGPVHLDVAFREPTIPGLDDGRTRTLPYQQVLDGRLDGAPWTRLAPVDPVGPGPATIDAVLRAVAGRRVLVVAGDVVLPLADLPALRDRGFPVLAEPTAGPGLGAGTAHASLVLAAGSGLAPRPDVVLRLGRPTLSRPALTGLADVPTVQVTAAGVVDPARSVADAIVTDPAGLVAALVAADLDGPPDDFTRAWADASARAADVVAAHLDVDDAPEPAVARRVAAAVGDRHLVVASSLPIRDLADHAGTATTGPVVANRGLAGIDGFTSTAVGVALAAGPTVGLAGDLSFLHDHNGLLVGDPGAVPLTLVVVDNDGGGIFHQVPAGRLDDFERLFGTPHGRDLAAVAVAAGVPATTVSVDEVGDEVARPSDGLRVVIVRTDRVRGAATRRAIASALRTGGDGTRGSATGP